MPIPRDFSPHPTPSSFHGTIHFRGLYAYLLDDAGVDWDLLQYDHPFTGVLNFASAASTKTSLQRDYDENDGATFTGIVAECSYDGSTISVLFLT